jgi:hypothetical protein
MLNFGCKIWRKEVSRHRWKDKIEVCIKGIRC